jgi:hypothetical protein
MLRFEDTEMNLLEQKNLPFWKSELLFENGTLKMIKTVVISLLPVIILEYW